MEQDQWLARSGAMTSKRVGGQGRQLGRDDDSSLEMDDVAKRDAVNPL